MIDSYSKILVVDDFEMVRFMLKSVLNELEIYDIKEATNGENAWKELENAQKAGKPFHMMFLDWNMPKTSGLDLLKMCRKDSRFEQLPIVMVTAESESSSVVKALSEGATDYVVKPFSADTVRKKIERINEKLKNRNTA